jgi:hypothetical protein
MGAGEKTFGDRDTLRGVTGGAAWQAAEGLTFGDLDTLRDEGVLLAGRYKVVKRLGEGGMGSVWLAEDSKLDGRKVAVKMLPAILAGKKGAFKQVKAEAMVAMKLSHSNIATVRAFEEDEGGNPFLVMDYIEGVGLDDILAEKGALGEEETVRLLGPVAAALDYAHSQGVVHRDVKPGNVMVRKDGTPFVLDFGIAREVQETMTRVTGKLSSGTLLYMSPEQLRGKGPKAAQDVYSFAAMVYECLAGRPPFFRGAIEDQIKNEAPEELPEGVAGKALQEGVMGGLAKEANQRPGSCSEILGLRGAAKRAQEARTAEEVQDDERASQAEEEERARGHAALFHTSAAVLPEPEALDAEWKARMVAEQRAEGERQRTLAQIQTVIKERTARGRVAGWAWFLAAVLVAASVGWGVWVQQKLEKSQIQLAESRKRQNEAEANAKQAEERAAQAVKSQHDAETARDEATERATQAEQVKQEAETARDEATERAKQAQHEADEARKKAQATLEQQKNLEAKAKRQAEEWAKEKEALEKKVSIASRATESDKQEIAKQDASHLVPNKAVGPAQLQTDAYVALAQAEAALDANRPEDAAALFRHALDIYTVISRDYPDFSTATIRYRTTYCQNQLAKLQSRLGVGLRPISSPDPVQ